jgi:hypothetical protein
METKFPKEFADVHQPGLWLAETEEPQAKNRLARSWERSQQGDNEPARCPQPTLSLIPDIGLLCSLRFRVFDA